MFPRGTIEEALCMWTDSDWAGDVATSWESVSRGYTRRNG